MMQLDKPNLTIENILTLLDDSKKNNNSNIDKKNLMIALNGVDIEMLEGSNTVAKSGDTVTIVTIVHGG